MRKALTNLTLIFVSFIIYYLQSNFFSWFNISGIMPNLFVILILFIGLFANKSMGTIYGLVIGIILDFLIGTKTGIYALSLGLIGYLAGVFDKNFSKDTKMTIIVMVSGATIIFEAVTYLLKYIFLGMSVEIVNFIIILLVEIVFNILLTIILYPLIQSYGYYVENEFKGNKILTRYF